MRKVVEQDHGLDRSLDMTTLLPLCAPALERREPVDIRLPIKNVNRTVGTILGAEITTRYGAEGLPRRHHPHPLHGLGRAELRRLPAAAA